MTTYLSAELQYNHVDTLAANPNANPSAMIFNPEGCDGGIAGELARMREHGYKLFRAVIATYCARCNGSGRINKTRKVRTQTRTIPYSYKPCPDCGGHNGPLSAIEYPV